MNSKQKQPKKDYYGLLELTNKSCSQTEIKQAYRKLALVSTNRSHVDFLLAELRVEMAS